MIINRDDSGSEPIENKYTRRIKELEERQQRRQNIKAYIGSGRWPEALTQAEDAGFFIFDDPTIVKHFPQYLHGLLNKAQDIARQAAAMASQAEADRDRAQRALDEVRAILSEQSAMEAFLLADEALRKLDVQSLVTQVSRLKQIVPEKFPEEWARNRLSCLENDRDWLTSQEWGLADARVSGHTWNELAAGRPPDRSRIAYLRIQSQLTAQISNIDRFASLVPVLRNADVVNLLPRLSNLESEFSNDPQLTPFEKLTYLEIASTWRQRANSLQLLQERLVQIEKDLDHVQKLMTSGRIITIDFVNTIEKHFRQHYEWLRSQLHELPPELFAVTARPGQTYATRWRQITRQVLEQLWSCRDRIETQLKESESSDHLLPEKWKTILNKLEKQSKEKEKEGEDFFLRYGSIDSNAKGEGRPAVADFNQTATMVSNRPESSSHSEQSGRSGYR